jgi:CRP/FNR family transcriptional regulator, cyclic AMP receptor protein
VAIENFERILADHPFFKDLAKPHLETIVGCAANVKFDAGAFIYREGTQADHFYLVRHGKVGVETFAPGNGAMTVETVDAGEVLGWSWLFPPYKAHFDARALTLVRALSLDGACLRAKCEKDPAFGYEIMKRFAPVLIQRLDSTRLQLLDLYGNGA